ncbi:MAG: hypothetical protein COT14_00715 [Candidatus Diapherotrites archaeon CG08_land_8_20_14_0_20_30_16]|nr:MAG: hypothetical protein COT14_00715 [Candidatus Diapherotrites archaeon CG08_land_8_20_14_0_20_30_16]
MIESDKVCCPRFDPAPWDNKTNLWKNKRFVKDKVFTLFYVPINFGSVIVKLHKKIDAAKATNPEYLCLSDHTSMWNMDLYLAVDRTIPNAENITLSGKFLTKVFEGLFKDVGNWYKDIVDYTKRKTGKDPIKVYYYYTTCPKCAKKYGKNYVVIFEDILKFLRFSSQYEFLIHEIAC